jgi:hypothetical protein
MSTVAASSYTLDSLLEGEVTSPRVARTVLLSTPAHEMLDPLQRPTPLTGGESVEVVATRSASSSTRRQLGAVALARIWFADASTRLAKPLAA